MTAEQLSDVGDAAASEFECLVGSVQPALTLVERFKCEQHRLLDRGGIGPEHDGILPRDNDTRQIELPSLTPKSYAKKAKWDS